MTTFALIKKNSIFLLLVFLVYAFLDWAITAYFDGLSADPSDLFDPYSMLGLLAVIVLEIFLFFVVVNRLSRSIGQPITSTFGNIVRAIAAFFMQISLGLAPLMLALFIATNSSYPDFHVTLDSGDSVLFSELTQEQIDALSDDQFISSFEKKIDRADSAEVIAYLGMAAALVILVFVLVVFALAPYFVYIRGVGIFKSFSSSYQIMLRKGAGYLLLLISMITVEVYFSSLSTLVDFDLYGEVISYWVMAAFMLMSFVMLFKIFQDGVVGEN